ncbi:MAG: hypothetical protein M3186_11590 [Actinomycetota bacterium]|nr:hypothetical protein [Actinomycetota bacterium]
MPDTDAVLADTMAEQTDVRRLTGTHGIADPRTTRRYDHRRHNLDRHAAYAVAAWFSGEDADIASHD